jgi:hypothetical protein
MGSLPSISGSTNNQVKQNLIEDTDLLNSKDDAPKLYEDIILEKLKNAKFPHKEQ